MAAGPTALVAAVNAAAVNAAAVHAAAVNAAAVNAAAGALVGMPAPCDAEHVYVALSATICSIVLVVTLVVT